MVTFMHESELSYLEMVHLDDTQSFYDTGFEVTAKDPRLLSSDYNHTAQDPVMAQLAWLMRTFH